MEICWARDILIEGLGIRPRVAASRCCAICEELCYCEQAKEEEVICVA